MSSIPRDPHIDSTLALMADGYEFITKRCRRFDSVLFTARIMGKPAVCIHGREAAVLFYDDTKLQRHGAIPRRIVTSLFGKKALHTLDGAAHRNRKAAFLSLMSPSSLALLVDATSREWRRAVRRWEKRASVVLFDEASRILTRATCAWAGVPLADEDVPRRAHDFVRMVDAFGGIGPRLWMGKLARMRTERWIAGIVQDVRSAKLHVDEDSALHLMATLRDVSGKLLDPMTAAVEVINVIRPTVAVSWLITFAALALHEHPDAAEKLASEPVGDGAGEYTDLFMQEVRRFYPFAPYLGAKVRTPFEWKGHRFEKGTLVILDLYGTNHDERIWRSPDEFRPERFRRRAEDAFDFIPQGGGGPMGHRCPGEWITMHQVDLALHFLTRCASYDVLPGQDLHYDLRRMPARPESGFVLRNVHATSALDGRAPRLPSSIAARDAAMASRPSVGAM